MLVNVARRYDGVDQGDHHAGDKPFPLVDAHVSLERGQNGQDFAQQAGFHLLFQPEGNDGDDVGKAVEKRGRNLVFALVGLVDGFDERLVEFQDNPDRQGSQQYADAAENR
jgi:hypothetical protein